MKAKGYTNFNSHFRFYRLRRPGQTYHQSHGFKPPRTQPGGRLFLDLPVQHVLASNAGMPAVGPWATLYVNTIRDKGFGDAIWARYNIAGDVEDGIKVKDDIPGNKIQPVLEVTKEDALNYRVSKPEEYAKALSLYAKANSAGRRADVLGIVCNLSESDIARTKSEIAAPSANQP